VWIKKILISEQLGGAKEYVFSKKTLITSSGVNTQGKSTLMRFIVWSFGFEIDLTSEFFDQNLLQTKVLVVSDDESWVLLRRGDAVSVLHGVSEDVQLNDLDNEKFEPIGNASDRSKEILENIYGEVGSERLLSQLIGLHYVDQDQGWTVYNSGIVVKKYSDKRTGLRLDFEKIVAYIQGHELEYEGAVSKIRELQEKKGKYDVLLNSNFDNSSYSSPALKLDESIENEVDDLKFKLNYVKNRISDLRESEVDFDAIRRLVNSYSLRVRIGNDIVNVTEENLVMNPNHSKIFTNQIQELEKLRRGLEARLKKISSLFDEENQIDRTYARISEVLSRAIISERSLKDGFETTNLSLQQNRDKLKKYYDIPQVLAEIAKSISEVSEKLYLPPVEPDKVYVNQLSESGAMRNLRVLTYRFGMLRWVEDKLGIELPIFIDSPGNNEMDDQNMEIMGEFLNDFFDGRQVVIATNKVGETEMSVPSWQTNYTEISLDNGVLGTRQHK
jgi:hypothetical protein